MIVLLALLLLCIVNITDSFAICTPAYLASPTAPQPVYYKCTLDSDKTALSHNKDDFLYAEDSKKLYIGDTTTTWVSIGPNVTSVSNTDGTLTISPTTGAVVASLNLAHVNTWTAAQSFAAGIKFNGATSGVVTVGVAAVAGTWTLTLPVNAGTSNSALITDGTGITSWQPVALLGVSDVFTASQTVQISRPGIAFTVISTGTGPTMTAQVNDPGTGVGNGAVLQMVNNDQTAGNQTLLSFNSQDSSSAIIAGARFAGKFVSHTAGAVSTDFCVQTRGTGTMNVNFCIDHVGATIVGGTVPTVSSAKMLFINSTAFASLGTPDNSAVAYCSDCDPATAIDQTCTSAGAKTGNIAVRLNGVWRCLG